MPRLCSESVPTVSSSSFYNDDIPVDLRQLMTNTARGVERLYRAAKRTARGTVVTSERRSRSQRRNRVKSRHLAAEMRDSSMYDTDEDSGTAEGKTYESGPHLSTSLPLTAEPRADTDAVRNLRASHRSGNVRQRQDGQRQSARGDRDGSMGKRFFMAPSHQRSEDKLRGVGRAHSHNHSHINAFGMTDVSTGSSNPHVARDSHSQSKRRTNSNLTGTFSPNNSSRQDLTHTSAQDSRLDYAMVHSRFGQRWQDTYASLAAVSTTASSRTATPAEGGSYLSPLHCTSAVTPESSDRTPPRAETEVNGTSMLTDLPPLADSVMPVERAKAQKRPQPVAPLSIVAPPIGEDVLEKLSEELGRKQEAMLTLRLEHARELASLQEIIGSTRLEASTSAQQAASSTAQVTRLQQQLDEERQSRNEAEERVRQLVKERRQLKRAEEEKEQSEDLARQSLQMKERELSRTQQVIMDLRQEIDRTDKARARAVDELREARQVASQSRERAASLEKKMEEMERRLAQQDAEAKQALRQLEDEFTRTSESYQDLLTDASKKMAQLEKVQYKYRILKETHHVAESERKQLAAAMVAAKEEHDTVQASLSHELSTLRARVAEVEAASVEAQTRHAEAMKAMQHQLEIQTTAGGEQAHTYQQHVDTANHTIQLLRSQVETLKREVAAEQAHAQELALKLGEAEVRREQGQLDQQKSAAAFKVQSEETISSLKRQLRDKDAKLQALAQSHAEPLERLRRQLDDERGKRATVEEQFSRYKKRAKEAEELAWREIRREQLRVSTAMATDQHNGSAADGGASSGAGGLAPTVSPSRDFRTPSQPSDSGPAKRHSSSPFSTSQSHVLLRRHQMRRRNVTRAPRGLSAESGAVAGKQASPPLVRVSESRSPPLVHTTGIGEAVGRAVFPKKNASRKEAPTSESPSSSDSHCSTPPVEEIVRRTTLSNSAPHSRHGVSAGAAFSPSNTSITPVQTVGSISGISCTSPCESSNEDDGELEVVAAAPPPPERQTSTPWFEHMRHLTSAATASPQRSGMGIKRHDPNRDGNHTESIPTRMQSGESQGLALDHGDVSLERRPTVAEHERRLHEFHTSAADVLRKITGSRDEFLAQCTAIVKKASVRNYDPHPNMNSDLGSD